MAINPMDVLRFSSYADPRSILQNGNPSESDPMDYSSIGSYSGTPNALAQQIPPGVTIPGMGGGAAGAGMGALGTAGGILGAGRNGGFGFNMDTANLALQGLATIANIWGAFEARNLAKKQFKFTRDVTNTNLANQISAYNTTLADRGRSRAFTEGQSAAQAQAYIDQNRLPERKL